MDSMIEAFCGICHGEVSTSSRSFEQSLRGRNTKPWIHKALG